MIRSRIYTMRLCTHVLCVYCRESDRRNRRSRDLSRSAEYHSVYSPTGASSVLHGSSVERLWDRDLLRTLDRRNSDGPGQLSMVLLDVSLIPSSLI